MTYFSALDKKKLDDSYGGLISREGMGAGTILSSRYQWVGASDFSSGIGLVHGVSGKDGLYGTYNGEQSLFVNAHDGTFQFGPSGKNVAYDGTNLTITGSNLVLQSGGYVWVGTPITDGVGFTDAGLCAASSGVQTLLIDKTDGSFIFGDPSGNNIAYDTTASTLYVNGATVADWNNIAGTNVPAPGADVTADNPQSPSWLTELISSMHLADGAVTAAKTAVAAIDPSSGNIAANHIVANMIQAGTITGDKIYGNTLAAINSDLGHVTAGSIDAGLITSGTLSVGFTEAKCTDPYADQTATHTSYNTTHANNTINSNGYYLNMYGDINVYNDMDISFFHGTSTNTGKVAGDYDGLRITATDDLILCSSGTTASFGSSYGGILLAVGPGDSIHLSGTTYANDIMTTSSHNLGSSSYKWNYVYANYIGHPSYKVSNVYATNIGSSSYPISTVYTSYIGDSSHKVSTIYASSVGHPNYKVSSLYVSYIGSSAYKTTYAYISSLGTSSYRTDHIYSSHLDINSGSNVTIGSSSSYFTLWVYSGGWASYPAYIT